MAEEMEMDVNLLEMYHERMGEIQNVSDTIAVASMQLNKILNKLGWSRQSLVQENKLEACPLDSNHLICKENMENHVRTCNLRKLGIISVSNNDLPPSPLYDKESSAVPLLVSKMEYEKMQKKEGRCLYAAGNEMQAASIVDESDNFLLECDDGINEYKPCNPLDELRFIYSWTKIPKKYTVLDILKIPKVQLRNWLEENLSYTCLADEHKEYLINSMINWLDQLPTPSQFKNHVVNLLQKDTPSFVLRLWKFLAAKCLCLHQQIPEHTRNEFDFYSTSMGTKGNEDDKVVVKHSQDRHVQAFLPMEWIDYNLTSEEKLIVYDITHKTSEMLRKPLVVYSDVMSQTEQQMKVIRDFDEKMKGEKSRMEVLAELRDYKRRRQSYRGKNKMTKKMSAIEVLRDLFEQQMLYLNILRENEKSKESDVTPKSEYDQTETSSTHKNHVENKERKRDPNRHREGSSRERERESQRNRSRSRDRPRSSRKDRYCDRSKERERYSNRKDSRSDRRYSDNKEISNITYYNDENKPIQ